MALSVADQQRIIGQESAWADIDFAQQLELNQFSPLPQSPPEQARDDERFGRNQSSETTATAFKRRCPEYLPTENNYQMMVSTLAFNVLRNSQEESNTDELVDALITAGAWTVANLEAVYLALSREGLLQAPVETPRTLSDKERMASSKWEPTEHADHAIAANCCCTEQANRATGHGADWRVTVLIRAKQCG